MHLQRFTVFILTILMTVTMLHTYVGADEETASAAREEAASEAGAEEDSGDMESEDEEGEGEGAEGAVSEDEDSEDAVSEDGEDEGAVSEDEDSEDVEAGAEESEDEGAGVEEDGSSDSVEEDESGTRYYRSQLSDDERLLYDALVTCALSENPSEEGDPIFLKIDPGSDEFRTMFRRAYNALLYDRPELYWLNLGGSSFQYRYSNRLFDRNTYKITFSLPEPYDEREEMMYALEEAADEFLSDIDLSAPDDEVALAVHDKLIDLVSYDHQTSSGSPDDLAHTAYGALIHNSSGEPNTAVCDGYSGAYKYLLQKAGIQCLILAGHAGDSEETAGNHSWNLVNLDGDWYEVDATWDDISSEDLLDSDADYSGIAEEASRNDWYMDKLTHYLFNVTTEEITYFEPDDYFTYRTDRGWVSFLKSSVHIRYTEEESDESGDYMTPLAPIAEGTEYSYR